MAPSWDSTAASHFRGPIGISSSSQVHEGWTSAEEVWVERGDVPLNARFAVMTTIFVVSLFGMILYFVVIHGHPYPNLFPKLFRFLLCQNEFPSCAFPESFSSQGSISERVSVVYHGLITSGTLEELSRSLLTDRLTCPTPGIILSTAFCHLLQDAFQALHHPSVKSRWRIGNHTGFIM